MLESLGFTHNKRESLKIDMLRTEGNHSHLLLVGGQSSSFLSGLRVYVTKMHISESVILFE